MKKHCQMQLNRVKDSKALDPTTATDWMELAKASDSRPSINRSFTADLMLDTSPNSCDVEQHLTQVLLTAATSQKALLNLAQTITEAFSAEGCFIWLQSHVPDVLQATGWYADGSTSLAQCQCDVLTLLRSPTVVDQWTAADPLLISDVQAIAQRLDTSNPSGSRSAATASSMSGLGAILATRSTFQGRTNGILVVIRSQPYGWKEADVQLLKQVSPHVAIALSQAQLDQKIQQQIQYQTLIDQLTTAIRNSWGLTEIFQLAVEGTVSALQADRGMLLLFKYVDPLRRSSEGVPNAKVSVVVDWSNPDSIGYSWAERTASLLTQDGHANSPPSFWISDCSLCQQLLAQRGEPVIGSAGRSTEPGCELSSGVNGDLIQDGVAPVFDLAALPSLLLMPLENQATVLGCLVLQFHQPRFWLPEEVAFVRLAAAQLSTAIIQTRTIQQIQAVVQERTAQLQRSLEVQAKLYEKTRQQVEQLRRLNEEREEFLSTVSHELRTPLTSMTLAIRMLRQADLAPDRRARYLDILEQQCTQETNLINDLLALRKLESSPSPTQLQKLDIRYLVHDAVQSMESEWAEKDLTLAIDLPTKPLTIYTDTESLNRILIELLTNAKKYSDSGSTVHLQVEHQAKLPASQVVLTLRNRGAGISPDELPHIFDKFRRGQGVTQQAIQGTGLGLALVKGLVEHLNGAIVASSQPLKQSSSWETCFVITLPQCPDGSICVIS